MGNMQEINLYLEKKLAYLQENICHNIDYEELIAIFITVKNKKQKNPSIEQAENLLNRIFQVITDRYYLKNEYQMKHMSSYYFSDDEEKYEKIYMCEG